MIIAIEGMDGVGKTTIASIDVNSFIDSINNYSNDYLKINGNTITGTINAETDDQTLLVDVANIKGWSATKNGKRSEITDAYNGLISIKLDKGKNEIVIKFIPKGIKLGLIVSLISLILLILFSKYKNIIDKISKFKKLRAIGLDKNIFDNLDLKSITYNDIMLKIDNMINAIENEKKQI